MELIDFSCGNDGSVWNWGVFDVELSGFGVELRGF